MSDEGFNSPSPEHLRIIRAGMPHIKAHKEQHQMAGAAKRAGFKPGDRLCNICSEKILIVAKKPSNNCKPCDQKLEEGQTAIVSIDGRFIFMQSTGDVEKEKDLFVAVTGTLPTKWPDDFTVKGCVLPTTAEIMNKLEQIYESQKPKEGSQN